MEFRDLRHSSDEIAHKVFKRDNSKKQAKCGKRLAKRDRSDKRFAPLLGGEVPTTKVRQVQETGGLHMPIRK